MNRRVHGMSLVELMLALLLGGLVVATVIGIFLANRKTMAVTQGIGQIQHNTQVALELLSRDLRQAGGNPCSRHIPLVNIIHAPASRWWTNLVSTQRQDGSWTTPWNNTLRGLTMDEFAAGSGVGARLAGSDAIELLSSDTQVATVVSHDGTRFVLNTANHGFSSGQLLLACEPRQASLFQGTVSGVHVTHPAGGLNCSEHLGFPGGCHNAERFVHAPHTLIARWNPVRWYLGHNGRGGISLYRVRPEGQQQGVTRQEMLANVTGLKFGYLLAGSAGHVALGDVNGHWEQVIAVHIEITVTAAAAKSENGEPLARTVIHTVSLRNRNP